LSACLGVWRRQENRKPGENPGRYRRCIARDVALVGESRSLGKPEKAECGWGEWGEEKPQRVESEDLLKGVVSKPPV
jgi:hypothetical protein